MLIKILKIIERLVLSFEFVCQFIVLLKALKTELIKLSVVVPAHNEADNLECCITNIEKILNENEIDCEIIVVDDNSTDNTIQILDNLCQQIKCLRVVKNKGKSGFGRAVRMGIQNFLAMRWQL